MWQKVVAHLFLCYWWTGTARHKHSVARHKVSFRATSDMNRNVLMFFLLWRNFKSSLLQISTPSAQVLQLHSRKPEQNVPLNRDQGFQQHIPKKGRIFSCSKWSAATFIAISKCLCA
eukprot:843314-Amphidinium_carterae.1